MRPLFLAPSLLSQSPALWCVTTRPAPFEGSRYLKTTLDKRCEMVARYLSLISATLPPVEMIPGKKEIVLLPMHKAYLTCRDGSAQPKTSASKEDIRPVPLGPAGITAPKKTRLVNPIYPKEAQMQRRQGLVIIEATPVI